MEMNTNIVETEDYMYYSIQNSEYIRLARYIRDRKKFNEHHQ